MRNAYAQGVKLGSSIIEILNPVSGEVTDVFNILSYQIDTVNKDLIVTGIDMTGFFKEAKYVSGDQTSFETNFTSFIQKSKAITRKFSSHHPYSVFSEGV